MSIVSDKNGNALVGIYQETTGAGNTVTEQDLINNPEYRPLASSLVVIKGPKGFMLLKNKYRNVWELAGGMIEANESPRQAAIRECLEESGYEISNLRFLGLLKFQLVPSYFSKDHRIEYSALYCADIDEIQDFIENNEMSDLCWYNIGDEIEDANDIDVFLLNYY